MAWPGAARLGTPARGHGARLARFAAAPDSPSVRARPDSATRPSPRGRGFSVSSWLGVPSRPRRGGAARPPQARPAPGLGAAARARPPVTPARLGHGGRSSAMASGATPGVPRSPPAHSSASAWALFARRAALARDPALACPFFPVAPPPRPRVRRPALAAGARPWPRRGFGAVRSPARLGGLLVRLARVACPRQRPARPRGLPTAAPGAVCSRGSPATSRRGAPPGVPARLRQPARLACGGLRCAWQPVRDVFAAAIRGLVRSLA
jgi:hypothetical protein